MLANLHEFIAAAQRLTAAEQREVLARLFPANSVHDGASIWRSVRYSEQARVVAYAPEQEQYLDAVRHALQHGVLTRIDSAMDGTYELYTPERTYHVVLTPEREFAALLSSWTPDSPPREITLLDDFTR